MWLRAMKLESLTPASVLHFSLYDQLIHATLAGQGVALGRSPLIDSLLRQRKLVAPFSQTIASPRSYYLVQSAAATRKPEVQVASSDGCVEAAAPNGRTWQDAAAARGGRSEHPARVHQVAGSSAA